MFFFFNDTATTEIYTLSLHDALPISCGDSSFGPVGRYVFPACPSGLARISATTRAISSLEGGALRPEPRSEEHTSELQSPDHLVCRLLLEKKNTARPLRGEQHCVETS